MTAPAHNPEQTTTRRNFLKQSAVATSLLSTSALAVKNAAYAAENSRIRVGMIGSGERCSGAAAQALETGPDVRLVAMCDVFEERVQSSLKNLKNLAKIAPQIEVDDDHQFVGFDGYQKVIDESDVVLIACASKFHPMYTEAAIKAGKHVFVEKPHGIDPVGIRRMRAACELAKQKGLSLMSGLQSRHSIGWQETIKRIHDGIIGDVISIQSSFMRGPYRVYKRNPELTETEYQFSNWYHFCWLSGDDVTQSLVHNLDRVSWILQGEMPEKAFGLAGRATSFGEVYGDMFDHHTAVYEYKSGVRVYALCRTQNGCHHSSNDLIQGAKGSCDLRRMRITGETDWQYQEKRNNPYQEEHNVLFNAIRTGKPVNSGDYMCDSTMTGILGQLACYSGKLTTWEQAADADFQFGPAPEETSFQTPPPKVPDATGNYPLPVPGISKIL